MQVNTYIGNEKMEVYMNTALKIVPQNIQPGGFVKRQDRFLDTCTKIRTAWDAMGYNGDPIMELMSSIQGMYLYAEEVMG